MSEGLNRLKTIGAQKIHETTHISKRHVQAILHESFEDISKIQFIGFLSILEREYNLELDDLKSKGLNYFEEFPQSSSRSETVFVTPKKEKSYTKLYLLFVIAIFIVVTIYSFLPSTIINKKSDFKELNNKTIENAKKIMDNNLILDTKKELLVSENNNLKEKKVFENNSSEVVKAIDSLVIKKEIIAVKIDEKPKEKKVKSSLIIKPKNRVWMGYIDIKTNKKYQTVFKKRFTFDTKKDWIIVFGHGHINLEIDGKIKSFNTKSNLRFLYKDGKLTKIDLKEFKRLNRGKTW